MFEILTSRLLTRSLALKNRAQILLMRLDKIVIVLEIRL